MKSAAVPLLELVLIKKVRVIGYLTDLIANLCVLRVVVPNCEVLVLMVLLVTSPYSLIE